MRVCVEGGSTIKPPAFCPSFPGWGLGTREKTDSLGSGVVTVGFLPRSGFIPHPRVSDEGVARERHPGCQSAKIPEHCRRSILLGGIALLIDG